jgi:hypothetical protein
MNHTELAERLEKRLNDIEAKLDKHLERSIKNETDLNWVRGHIRNSVVLMITLIGGVVTTFLRTLD